MYRKSEMRKMEREELRKIAMEKNKKGIATLAARYAQELLWEARYPWVERREDDYEGWSLLDDEYR